MCFLIDVFLEAKGRFRLFLGHEDIICHSLNIFIFQMLLLVHDDYLIYVQQDNVAKRTWNLWSNLYRKTHHLRPQHTQLSDSDKDLHPRC